MTTKAGCDHKNMHTEFCPNCGEPQEPGSLSALLAHVSKQASDAKRSLSDLRKYLKKNEADGYDCDRSRRLKTKLAKWTSWRDKLKALLEADGAD